jgi:hypothetical protein
MNVKVGLAVRIGVARHMGLFVVYPCTCCYVTFNFAKSWLHPRLHPYSPPIHSDISLMFLEDILSNYACVHGAALLDGCYTDADTDTLTGIATCRSPSGLIFVSDLPRHHPNNISIPHTFEFL